MASRRSESASRTAEEAKKKRQKDRELKRLRGEISCAECRRSVSPRTISYYLLTNHSLKLKCDKQVPCGSCARRGCQSICPNGVLTGGQGTR